MTQTVREKFSCRACRTIAQAPTPFYVFGCAGPDLLSMVLHELFELHQILNRLSEDYGREDDSLPLSTPTDPKKQV